jgi:hypothetical protein
MQPREKSMKRTALLILISVGMISPTFAADSLVKFQGGIGVNPVSSGRGEGGAALPATQTFAPEVNRNFVRDVSPPGQIWVIKDLKAKIGFDGRAQVKGQGLLLGGGNNVGRVPAGTMVFATLSCGASAPFTFHSTALTGVPLKPDGSFQIDDTLTGDSLPSTCANAVLLIRSTGGARSWFAAGIEQVEGED